jgi:hypothetical protein
MTKKLKNESGVVLIVCLFLLIMLSMIGISAIKTSNTDMDVSGNVFNKTAAFYLAEAGAEKACAILSDSTDWRAGFGDQDLGGGNYNVTITDSSSNPSMGNKVKITSTGTCRGAKSTIEIVMGPALIHPLYDYAIYAGNFMEYDPDADPMVWSSLMAFGGCGGSADLINGDIFFNGNIDVDCDAQVNGTIDAGGSITGNSPSGDANDNTPYLDPPDLASMNYEALANFVVGNASPWNAYGRLPGYDPRHIFVREYRSDLATEVGFTFDNTNYFLGDPYESYQINEVSISPNGNHKVYFVDGNLWIEPGGQVSQLVNSPPEGTQITIVVKGNIYFCDDFQYDNEDLDGVAFIAMSDGESYNDLNSNNQYDAGEPILHDDGDGVYEGNREGSGNVCFGDPNGGPLGNISGFIYADNNFEDHVLDGPTGEPQTFGVTGLLSAGNQFNVNRDYGGLHAEMTINYDQRLHNGIINLPGLPQGSLISGWVVLSWIEL